MVGFIIAGFLILLFSKELPDAQSIRGIELQVPLRVYSADNLLISEFGNERRKPIPYNEAPQLLIDAVLASEDDGFFEHGGIDIKGLIRAVISNARSGRSGQGASTITMQVARNFFLSPEKTYNRKIKEVLLSVRLEQLLSKEEILSLYLNKIFLGHRSYGFGAASDVYYGKPLNELSAAQVAMLAGLPKAPSSFNPIRNPERAKIRRNYVLSRLHELGKLDSTQYQTAKDEAISAVKHNTKLGLVAPHIAEMVRSFVIDKYGKEAYWQGLNVHTTILAKQQNAAQTSLRNGLQAYDRRHGFRGAVGKVDIDNIIAANPVPLDLDQALENALRLYPASQEQIPAITLLVSDEKANVWNHEHGEIEILLDDAKWAKRHKTANLIGSLPKKMSQILMAGDIIYIKPKLIVKNNNTLAQDQGKNTKKHWQLSQIPNVGGALISMAPHSGQILSLVGGYDFFLNKYNRAVQSIRQPGSNIKPFIYSASLDQGLTPASLISGAPIVITDQAHGTLWRPENYSGKFYGLTRMRLALAKSMNLVSIRILRTIGIPTAREYLSRFGIDMSRFSSSLTMALGSGGVTPLEVLNAYSALANGGYRVKPYFIERITDRDGSILFEAPRAQLCDECYKQYLPKPENNIDEITIQELESAIDQEETRDDQGIDPSLNATSSTTTNTYQAPRVMSHANNFLTVSMMKDVVKQGTARRALSLKRTDLAGKTGTTNDYVDAWFTGFNSKVATTVWVGFDKPSSMGRGEAGSLTALPIWVEYMKTGLDGVAEDSTELPPYINEILINSQTGKQTDDLDPKAIKEYKIIHELTPEYIMLETGTQALSNDLTEETMPPLSDQLNDELDVEPIDTQIQERIIEEKEDTEGLF